MNLIDQAANDLILSKSYLDRGEMDFIDFLDYTDPTSEDGVWAPVVKKLTDIINSSQFKSLNKTQQRYFTDKLDNIAGQDGEQVQDIYTEARVNADDIKRMRADYRFAPDMFTPALDFTEDLARPVWTLVSAEEASDRRLATNDFAVIQVTGELTGIERPMLVRLKELEDLPGIYEGALPGEIGIITVDKSNAVYNSQTGQVMNINYYTNYDEFSKTGTPLPIGKNGLPTAQFNSLTHNQYAKRRDQFVHMYKRYTGKDVLQSADFNWIDDRMDLSDVDMETEIRRTPEAMGFDRPTATPTLPGRVQPIKAPGAMGIIGKGIKQFAEQSEIIPFLGEAAQAIFPGKESGGFMSILQEAREEATKGFPAFRSMFKGKGF